MHEDLIRQLNEAVTEVFAVMLNLTCAVSEPGPVVEPLRAALTASVQFTGPLQACCCLQMDERTANELAANLTGLPPITITRDLSVDVAGELCNMIAGCWKKRHPADSASSHLSCPIVTNGLCHHSAANFSERVTLPYHFDGHHVILHVAFN
jgi:chemotaxis protein CheX